MIRVQGSSLQSGAQLARRDFMQIGGAGLLGLGLPDLLRAEASGRKGKAKSCILLYLYGAPSQLETFDPKPNAPLEIRGELGFTSTSVPGLTICDRLPRLAPVMNKVTVLRSVTHQHPIHGVAFATTGTPTIDVAMELAPRDSKHWPYIGSVVDFLGQSTRKPGAAPDNIALPFPMSSQRTGEVQRAGPYPAFLGGAHAPIWTRFEGNGTVKAKKTLQKMTWEDFELYRGVSSDCRFSLGDTGSMVELDRLDQRMSLAQQLEAQLPAFDGSAAVDRQRSAALDLLRSARVREALDLRHEPDRMRQRYGMELFGQGALAARRLVEAGSRFVSVFWDEYGLAGTGWDTHWDHFPRMKEELLPGLDNALSGLLIDLDDRGMLDETLVVCLSEHGRTPRIQNVTGGGRDHWAQVYSVVMAGGGIARGKVIGKSDKIGGTVAERAISPKDILATIYHLLGFDPETTLLDRTGRPAPLVAGGHILTDALA